MTAKLPQQPPADLSSRDPDWNRWQVDAALWHVGDASGPYANPFGTMRSYGPLASARFDPHPLPAREHPSERVLHAAADLVTGLAERFQNNREIRCQQPGNPVAYSWFPTRTLQLIDLTGVGALRLGVSQLLSTGPKNVTRTWSRALRQCWPAADGLLYRSSMAGRDCVTLWSTADDSYPSAPAFAKLLSDPVVAWIEMLRSSAVQAGYTFSG